FLSHFGLLIDMKNKRLIDNVTGLSHFGRISAVNHFTICTTLPNSTYQKLLAEFPSLTNFAPISTIKNHGVEHHILIEGQPIYSTPRRLSPEKLKFAKAEFISMIENVICRLSSSTRATPFYMVPKPNNTWRLCGDYRALNAVTIPDRYPLPHIQDFTSGLHDIVHISAGRNSVVALSRIDSISMPVIVSLEELAEAQLNDEELKILLTSIHRLAYPDGNLLANLFFKNLFGLLLKKMLRNGVQHVYLANEPKFYDIPRIYLLRLQFLINVFSMYILILLDLYLPADNFVIA
ncbi:PREDICTED: uncharacterized protein LOC108781192, partial [Cyphomyrmex costatus]|uniref:uncharacterized protein LOC108781192 n=1 Tax=Cyphomyrmex costatus TaxID=456900 RepID=UPI0008522E43